MSAKENKPISTRRGVGLALIITLGLLVSVLLWLPWVPIRSCTRGSPSCVSSIKDIWNGAKPSACVAHALGEIDGIFYTNSLDAFLLNYERGFRTFEVDLVLLGDGSVFCAHDGSEWMYGLGKAFAETTAADMSGRLCLGKYTPLDGSDLLDLMDEYPDTRFFLHAKRTSKNSNQAILEVMVSEAKESHPSVLDRIIPRTYGPADMRQLDRLHRFREYWVEDTTFHWDIDRSSSAGPDRIVLYVITRGGPLGFRRTGDLLPHCAFAVPFSGLLSPVLMPFSPLMCSVRICVSLDIATEEPASEAC
ncbi:MAG: hypothetical protein QUS33_08045 [Dehalococcoidia bacterium]|nr:hypothetical protein [Dehalococcoidia bacterium]